MEEEQAKTIMGNRKKVILDVDTGIDDALAILYALKSPNLEVLGITTCFGNVDVDTATENTLAVVQLINGTVPVYRGAESPVARKWSGPVPWIHGENGLGDAPLPELSLRSESVDAVTFIKETVHAHPGEVTIIPVARMTNLARAIVENPELSSEIKEVVFMGGAAFCPGNVTPVAEANIWGDPEAAKLVFQSGVPLSMVGLDVTLKARLFLSEIERISEDTAYGPLLKQALRFYIGAYEGEGVEDAWCPLHDPMAVAMVEHPEWFEAPLYPVDVETDGRITAGMTVVDARAKASADANVRVCTDVRAHDFLEAMRERLGIL
ncbi:nucleoside hydrolase [Alicyclobacillus sp. SO9]|uniref:nucleoside hydrolase n=1 Tax=Alicyclobacillus sp. SO9 TaxID=2665646 RepID=UPI0018E78A80|nr:nucleoside hydrolase [Alicyclobacillus sp. SO9]QQE77411.1 nucleoside hydrolase [Alicyclobacillus sp. SO9]